MVGMIGIIVASAPSVKVSINNKEGSGAKKSPRITD
jgi:hypothetical protein